MADDSAVAYGYASTTFTLASTLSSSTAHLDWVSIVLTFLLSIFKSSLGIFLLWFNCLVQRDMIICCAGLLLVCLYSGELFILLGFDIGSFLGFTVELSVNLYCILC